MRKSTFLSGHSNRLFRLLSKRLLIGVCVLFSQVSLYAANSFPWSLQSVTPNMIPTPKDLFASAGHHFISYSSEDWVYDKTIGKVEFYHRIAECQGQKAVFLKFVNKNTSDVLVSWKEVFSTQKEAQVEGYKGKKALTIKPGENFPASCHDESFRELVILPLQVSPAYLAEIKQFSFKDISVNKAL